MNTFNRMGLKMADAIGDLGRNLADVPFLPLTFAKAIRARRNSQIRDEITCSLKEEVRIFGSLAFAGRVFLRFVPEEKDALKGELREIGNVYKERRYA